MSKKINGTAPEEKTAQYILLLQKPGEKGMEPLLTIELDGTVTPAEGADMSEAAKQFYLALELEGRSLHEHIMFWKGKFGASLTLGHEIIKTLKKYNANTLAGVYQKKLEQLMEIKHDA